MSKHVFRYVLSFSKKEKQPYKEKCRAGKKIKSVQNVIIKNENNSWLKTLLHLKKYRFLIFVRLDLVSLENCARM